MLYTRFVFTKVGKKAIKRLQDKIDEKLVIPDSPDEYVTFDFEGDFEDEELYKICCNITSFIISEVINFTIKTSLLRTLGDFNNDEFRYVCNTIENKEFLKEIPGRMYVYVKMNQSVNPIGFYRFMCRDIDNKVCKSVSDEANCILEMNEKADMIETLKYFSDMSPECVNRVVITANCGRIEIKECIPPREDMYAEYSTAEADVLAELVTLNPRCIEIHGKDEFEKNEISSLIEAVFENRIEYR